MLPRRETLQSAIASDVQGQFCTSLGHQCALRWQTRPGMSEWSLEITYIMDIDSDPCCSMAMDPDVTLSGSTGWDFTTPQVAGLATHNKLFLFTLCSSISLHKAQTVLLPSLSICHHTLAHCSSSCYRCPHGWQALDDLLLCVCCLASQQMDL